MLPLGAEAEVCEYTDCNIRAVCVNLTPHSLRMKYWAGLCNIRRVRGAARAFSSQLQRLVGPEPC